MAEAEEKTDRIPNDSMGKPQDSSKQTIDVNTDENGDELTYQSICQAKPSTAQAVRSP